MINLLLLGLVDNIVWVYQESRGLTLILTMLSFELDPSIDETPERTSRNVDHTLS